MPVREDGPVSSAPIQPTGRPAPRMRQTVRDMVISMGVVLAIVGVFVAAAILTIPNFFANRLLVWKDTTKDRLRTQILVFWVAAMLGVTIATSLTYVVEQQVHDEGIIEPIAVFFAQLLGFGIVWVGRYIILDRWLFKVTHHGEEPDEDDLEMLHGDLPI